jgi:hypothetical protein
MHAAETSVAKIPDARTSDAGRLFGKYQYKVTQIVSVDEMKQTIKRKASQ